MVRISSEGVLQCEIRGVMGFEGHLPAYSGVMRPSMSI